VTKPFRAGSLRFLFLRIEARFASLSGFPCGLPFRASRPVHPCGISFRVLLAERSSGPPLFQLSLRSAFPGLPFGLPSLAVPCGLPWQVFQSNGLPFAPACYPWPGITSPLGFVFGPPCFRRLSALPVRAGLLICLRLSVSASFPSWDFSQPFIARLMKQMYSGLNAQCKDFSSLIHTNNSQTLLTIVNNSKHVINCILHWIST
jgi:hypothetical protein